LGEEGLFKANAVNEMGGCGDGERREREIREGKRRHKRYWHHQRHVFIK
jgi:hypothetical protein